MRVKKAGGKIIGAELTVAERKAMEIEINRQIAEHDRKHVNDIDALVLYQLRVQFGFGKKRLKRFFDNFAPALAELIRHYEMPNASTWICTEMLKRDGIDIEAWNDRGRVK